MRLVQLLGLPPACDYDCITFFYAEADGLFRPTPDNETTDHEAELDFPASATPDYREWFEDNKQFSTSRIHLIRGHAWGIPTTGTAARAATSVPGNSLSGGATVR
ncbi:MAG: hypothetical protein ACLTZT_05115 [Butyricimonas faecalis]